MKNKYLSYFLFPLLILLGCFAKVEKVDFILPKGFTGNCVIMYNCRDGMSPLHEGGVKQIVVPASGIVKLKEKAFWGEIKYRYFITGSNKELKVYQSFQVSTSDSVYVGQGTIVTNLSLDSNQKTTENLFAFVFYVHKMGEIIPSNYDDSWIKDTLAKQARINEDFGKN